MKIQSASTQSFSEHAPSFNYRISMDTKGPINPPSHNKSFIHVIIDAFSHFVVTVPIKSNNAKTAIKTLLHHWIIKFGPPIYLVTDRGSEYVNKEMTHLCTLMGIRHSPRTAYFPWTNGLVEVQNRNLGTHLRMFLRDTPKDWAFQVHLYAYAHNSQPLSELIVSPHEIVCHTRPRIPLTFDLNLNRDTSKTFISAIALNFQNTHIMTNQIPIHFLQNTFKTHSTMVSRCRNCYGAIIFNSICKHLTKNQFTRIHNKNIPRRKTTPTWHLCFETNIYSRTFF